MDNKTRIGVAIAVAGVLMLGLPLLWKGIVAIDHWQRAANPKICVKSHTIVNTHFVSGIINGKYQSGMVTDSYTVCDKEAPNPYYKGKK